MMRATRTAGIWSMGESLRVSLVHCSTSFFALTRIIETMQQIPPVERLWSTRPELPGLPLQRRGGPHGVRG